MIDTIGAGRLEIHSKFIGHQHCAAAFAIEAIDNDLSDRMQTTFRSAGA